MSSIKNTTEETLKDLKKMVILTGRLSEVHEKTLKNAPFIFFDHLKKVEISHDINTESGMAGTSRVIFTLSFEEGYEPDLLEYRVKALKNTVHTILWPEVAVGVYDEKGKSLV